MNRWIAASSERVSGTIHRASSGGEGAFRSGPPGPSEEPDRSTNARGGVPPSRGGPPDWLVLTFPEPTRERLHLAAHTLRDLGARHVAIGDGRLWAYFTPDHSDPEELLQSAGGLLRACGVPSPVTAGTWDRSFRSPRGGATRLYSEVTQPSLLRVSERFTVMPVVDRGAEEGSEVEDGGSRNEGGNEDEVVLRIGAGLSFGDGSHPTTRGCLKLLEPLPLEGERILDVGSGTGVLSVAAARLGARVVEAVDLDPYAVRSTGENARLNGVEDRVRCRRLKMEARHLSPLRRPLGRFGGIVANLELEVLRRLVPGFPAALKGSGWVILSGVPGVEVDDIRSEVRRVGLTRMEEREDEGWWSARFTRGA